MMIISKTVMIMAGINIVMIIIIVQFQVLEAYGRDVETAARVEEGSEKVESFEQIGGKI